MAQSRMVGAVPRHFHEQKREFHSPVTHWEQHKAGMCCQLPTVKLPDWTPKNTHPPWGQSAPLRGKLFPPRQHWHFAFCHKIGGNRKWHQEPFARFTQETLPRPMLYTAVDDLGEQKGTLLFPLFLFYFFTYCNIFFCTR